MAYITNMLSQGKGSSSRNLFTASARNLSSRNEFQICNPDRINIQHRPSHPPALLIRVRKIFCAPRATFCRSAIPLQAPKNLRAVEIHAIGSSFIYSCRRLGEHFRYILQLKVGAGQGCLSHKTRGMLVAAQYQTLGNDALGLLGGC